MTAEEYINAIIARNPAIGRPDNETVTLTARGLRGLIRQAHEKGAEHERSRQSAKPTNSADPFERFNSFFGGKK